MAYPVAACRYGDQLLHPGYPQLWPLTYLMRSVGGHLTIFLGTKPRVRTT